MSYFIINYKTYPQATAANAEELTRILSDLQKHTQVQIIVCPQTTDLFRLRAKFPNLVFWAQHIDPLPPGRNTGWTVPTAVRENGGSGALINHSEHQITEEMSIYSIQSLYEEKLQSCLLMPNVSVIKALHDTYSKYEYDFPFRLPNFTGYEPPELVGGDFSPLDDERHYTNTQNALEEIKKYNTIPLLGAGIKDASDVSRSFEMGFEGVLIASGFVKNPDPRRFAEDILSAFPG